jgi:methionine-rich copper-binding protein CopC
MTMQRVTRLDGLFAHRWYAALAVLVAVVATVLLGTSPASAHTELVRANPAPGASVAGHLDRIELDFSSPVLPRLAEVLVTRTTDRSRVSGRAESFDDRVVVPVRALAPGGYLVAYRVVAADGHPVVGSYSFTVGRVRATVSRTVPIVPIAPSSPGGGNAPWLVPAVAVSGAAVVVAFRVRRAVSRAAP